MDAAHIHLLLNHVPVLGLVFTALLLAYGLARRSDDVIRASFWAFGLVGLAAVVVHLTGEPAEELLEGLPGFTEEAMERHEQAALWATWASVAVGAVALGGLYVYRNMSVPRRYGLLILAVALLAVLPMAWTANLGGEIRHEEIRAPAGETGGGGEGAAAEGRAADGAGAAGRQDRRTPIPVPEPARQTVLAEMRQMLEALHGVLDASVPFDRAAVQEAALSGGTRIAVDMDPAMARRLPEAFVRLGSSVHEDFDALAAAADEGAPRDSLLARLSAMTSKCVACHVQYRLETAEVPD